MAANGFQLKVDTVQLQNAAGKVRTDIGGLRSAASEISRLVSQTAGMWQGDAAEAKRAKYISNQNNADQILRKIEGYPNKLLVMAGIQEQAEKTAAEKVPSLDSNVLV